MPKNFVRQLFSVAVISGTEKTWIKRGGSIKIFRRKFFVSQCRNHSQVNPSLLFFGKNPAAKNITDKSGGVSRFSVENFLSRSAEKIRMCTLLCCVSGNTGSEKVYG